MFICACPPGGPAAGESSTGSPFCQPAGPREGSCGGRGRAGAMVHINGFPMQKEGKEEQVRLVLEINLKNIYTVYK